jgi:hypothetical protein
MVQTMPGGSGSTEVAGGIHPQMGFLFASDDSIAGGLEHRGAGPSDGGVWGAAARRRQSRPGVAFTRAAKGGGCLRSAYSRCRRRPGVPDRRPRPVACTGHSPVMLALATSPGRTPPLPIAIELRIANWASFGVGIAEAIQWECSLSAPCAPKHLLLRMEDQY